MSYLCLRATNKCCRIPLIAVSQQQLAAYCSTNKPPPDPNEQKRQEKKKSELEPKKPASSVSGLLRSLNALQESGGATKVRKEAVSEQPKPVMLNVLSETRETPTPSASNHPPPSEQWGVGDGARKKSKSPAKQKKPSTKVKGEKQGLISANAVEVQSDAKVENTVSSPAHPEGKKKKKKRRRKPRRKESEEVSVKAILVEEKRDDTPQVPAQQKEAAPASEVSVAKVEEKLSLASSLRELLTRSAKEAVVEVGESLGGGDPTTNTRIKSELFAKLAQMDKESRETATGAAESRYRHFFGRPPPPREHQQPFRQLDTAGIKARSSQTRINLFHFIREQGVPINLANQMADDIHDRAQQIMYGGGDEASGTKEEAEDKQTNLFLDFALDLIKAEEDSRKTALKSSTQMRRREYTQALPPEQAPHPKQAFFDFSDLKQQPIFTNLKKLQPQSLSFWKQWDDKNELLAKKMLGPRNSIEEEIELTKQGKMWPYPINNEYRLNGTQENFVDHVFLEPYWAKQGVPHSNSVAHFIELVLVGLSKNPHMSVKKKRSHLDWFANYFKSEMHKYNEGAKI